MGNIIGIIVGIIVLVLFGVVVVKIVKSIKAVDELQEGKNAQNLSKKNWADKGNSRGKFTCPICKLAAGEIKFDSNYYCPEKSRFYMECAACSTKSKGQTLIKPLTDLWPLAKSN